LPPPPTSFFPYTTLFRSLANRDGELAPVELERCNTFRRLEVTILVEDIVGRQQRFLLTPDDVAALQNGDGIGERTAGPRRVLVQDRKSTRLNSSHDQISY